MPKLKKAEVTWSVNRDSDDGMDVVDALFYRTPPSRKGSTKEGAISVEQYNKDRDPILSIRADLEQLTKQLREYIDLSQDHTFIDDDTQIIFNVEPGETPIRQRRSVKRLNFNDSVTEKGEPSNSTKGPDFVCEICAEYRPAGQLFSIKGCSHSYCRHCMVQYVTSKLEENITNIRCPVADCTEGLLDPEHCRSILPAGVFDRWGNALCEALVLESQKFYCPFKDCSAMLIDDGGEVIRESECPNCRRLFCAQCKVAWHSGIGCDEFQKLNKDEREREDIMLMALADERNWKRCPSCRIYVERTYGCNFVKCRCGTSFCYLCGDSQAMSEAWHYCSGCKR